MRTVLSCGLLAGSVLIGACQGRLHPAGPVALPPTEPEPGTYRLILCAEPCSPADTASAVATATVVIIDLAEAKTRAAWDALPLKAISSGQISVTQNACFKVTERRAMVGSESLHFGITPKAITKWEGTEEAGFSMLVFQSIDASYSLRWTNPGALMRGEGWTLNRDSRTSYANLRGDYHRNAYFAAERLGPPDPALCK